MKRNAKTKTFDCVAMKRAAAAGIYRKTRGMTFCQKVEFWRAESAALAQEHAASQLRAKSRR